MKWKLGLFLVCMWFFCLIYFILITALCIIWHRTLSFGMKTFTYNKWYFRRTYILNRCLAIILPWLLFARDFARKNYLPRFVCLSMFRYCFGWIIRYVEAKYHLINMLILDNFHALVQWYFICSKIIDSYMLAYYIYSTVIIVQERGLNVKKLRYFNSSVWHTTYFQLFK